MMHSKGDIDAVCREHLFTEKIIVTPHASGGRQLREGCARRGTPWLNLYARSVEGLARHVLGETHPYCRGRLTEGQALRMLAGLCAAELDDDSRYAPLSGNRGFHRALFQAFEDCRLAGHDPAALPEQHFSDPAKAVEFRRLAAAFRAQCRRDGSATRAEVIRAAEEACGQASVSARILLVEPGIFDLLPPAERRLLERAGPVVLLSTPEEGARRLQFRRAQRTEWEIREAFRLAIADAARWEDAEIVLLRPELLPLVYELSRQLDIPATFDPGVPLHYSKAARTVTAYLRWISSDYDAAHLVRMMYDGVPDFSDWKSDGVRGGRLSCAALLREAAVGRGRDRYLERIDARIHEMEIETVPAEADAGKKKQLNEYRANRAWIARLLEVTPLPDDAGALSLHALAEGLRALVTEMSRDKFPGEQQALEEMARLLDNYTRGVDVRDDASSLARMITEDIRGITFPLVLQDPGAEPLRVTTPQPGHLHVSLRDHGGYSGRTRTIILGADAETLPQSTAQNPVLLDAERQGINRATGSELRLASAAPARSIRAFEALLQRLEGTVYLSWSERDARGDTPRFPSRLLVDLLRRQADDASLQVSDLRQRSGLPVGAAPAAAALSMGEWWLQQRVRHGAPATRAGMRRHSSLLDHGTRAEEHRRTSRFGPYDGFVPAPEGGHPLPSPLSASRLETLAACPYRFFLRTVLRLREPEPWQRDEDHWLNAAEKGQAVHRILHLFMAALQNGDASPVTAAHEELLTRVAGEVLDAYAARIPVPSAAARRETERGIRPMLSAFLREECRSEGVPLALERSFGHTRAEEDALPALPIALPGGTMLISGTIDRIDRQPDGSTLVRDYKTGRKHCDPQKGLDGGRVLQHALYAEAVRAFLLTTDDGAALHSEYFFLSEKEQGSRVRMPDATAELPFVLDSLRTLISTGVFPHSTRKTDCRACDFADLCGESAEVCAQSQLKTADEENRMLEPFRRLQHD
jgi:ATP-dependent helicase/nuclease subunit B